MHQVYAHYIIPILSDNNFYDDTDNEKLMKIFQHYS